MDVKVKIPCWGKEVLVQVRDGTDPKTVFNAVAKMMDENKIADPECGMNPATATHKIVKQPDGQYRLQAIPRP